ncbi:MAG: hypothetical protein RLZZ347_584 [Candidatus Parcubacteria bacterium]|jgi:prepilin-type N-terminal cleavage/methylation domain-containing protein
MSLYSKTKQNSGFTLVELLVVISIIALLSSIVFAGLNVARQKGRDTSRVAGANQLRAAIELYRTTTGTFPDTLPVASSCASGATALSTVLNSLVTGKHIAQIPSDPTNTGTLCYKFYGKQTLTSGGFSCGINGTSEYAVTFTTETMSYNLLKMYSVSGGVYTLLSPTEYCMSNN